MKPSVSSIGSKLMRRVLRASIAGVAFAGIGAAVSTACLDRPVGEQTPRVSNIFVDQIAQTAIDKIDLLFMIDNSVSMQDKQQTLIAALPELVDRLITPICIGQNGQPTGQRSDQEGNCPQGSEPEFTPIRDIHIGVVSSSLGAHGGEQCKFVEGGDRDVSNEDNAHLLASLPRGSAVVDAATADLGF
ncbi:MAG TPA: hypothetical protein VK524_03125, partial [Polyangiaceae bacterium]|nr:hypothetical protein [Polyangiaceae bacterium]